MCGLAILEWRKSIVLRPLSLRIWHIEWKEDTMTNKEHTTLPQPNDYSLGDMAITTTPVVGTPPRDYAETFVPGDDGLQRTQLRVTVLGSGNPWGDPRPSFGQHSGGNRQAPNVTSSYSIFDSAFQLANYASLEAPIKSWIRCSSATCMPITPLTWLHSLAISRKSVVLMDPSLSGDRLVRSSRLGTRHFVEGILEALAWDIAGSSGAMNPDSLRIEVSEFDFSQTQVAYEQNGVKVTSFPVVHALSGSVGYRLDFAGLSFVYSGTLAQLGRWCVPAKAATCSSMSASHQLRFLRLPQVSPSKEQRLHSTPPIPHQPLPLKCSLW